jgi:hypothetical protein
MTQEIWQIQLRHVGLGTGSLFLNPNTNTPILPLNIDPFVHHYLALVRIDGDMKS